MLRRPDARRAAVGVSTGDPWQAEAECAQPRHDPELWHNTGNSWTDWDSLGRAIHVCWEHCPVRTQCLAEYGGMRSTVAGGVYFNDGGEQSHHQPQARTCALCAAGGGV